MFYPPKVRKRENYRDVNANARHHPPAGPRMTYNLFFHAPFLNINTEVSNFLNIPLETQAKPLQNQPPCGVTRPS